MSVVEHAARIIRDNSNVDGESLGYAHSFNIAQALVDNGLLMPDLPEPQAIGAGEYQYTDDRVDEIGHVSAWESGVIGITLPHGSGHQSVTVGEALHLVAGLMKLIEQDTHLTEAEKEQDNE